MLRTSLSALAIAIGAGVAAAISGTVSWHRATGAAVELVEASTPSPAFDAAFLLTHLVLKQLGLELASSLAIGVTIALVAGASAVPARRPLVSAGS